MVRTPLRGGQTSVDCVLTVPGVPHTDLMLARRELTDASVTRGLLVRLENRLHGLDKHREENVATIDRLRREIAQAHDQLDQPFAHEQALQQARAAVAELDARMAGRAARDEMTPAQRALHELAERAHPLIADQQDATAAGRVMLAVVAADGAPEMEGVRRSARDMLITDTREHPAVSGWRAIPPDGEPLPRGVSRDDLVARVAAMDRMAAVLEILDVTDTLVRDRDMTLPAGLRQFAAGARLALAGEPAPTGTLTTATPEAPNRALTAATPPTTTTGPVHRTAGRRSGTGFLCWDRTPLPCCSGPSTTQGRSTTPTRSRPTTPPNATPGPTSVSRTPGSSAELEAEQETPGPDRDPTPRRPDPVAEDAARMAATAEGTGVDVAWAIGENTYALLHRAAYDVLHRNPQRTNDPREELIDGLRRLGYDEDRLEAIADGAVQNPHRVVDLAIRNARVRIGYRERSHIMSPAEFAQLNAGEQLDVVDQLARAAENPDDVEYLLGQLSDEQLQPLRDEVQAWPADDPLRQHLHPTRIQRVGCSHSIAQGRRGRAGGSGRFSCRARIRPRGEHLRAAGGRARSRAHSGDPGRCGHLHRRRGHRRPRPGRRVPAAAPRTRRVRPPGSRPAADGARRHRRPRPQLPRVRRRAGVAGVAAPRRRRPLAPRERARATGHPRRTGPQRHHHPRPRRGRSTCPYPPGHRPGGPGRARDRADRASHHRPRRRPGRARCPPGGARRPGGRAADCGPGVLGRTGCPRTRWTSAGSSAQRGGCLEQYPRTRGRDGGREQRPPARRRGGAVPCARPAADGDGGRAADAGPRRRRRHRLGLRPGQPATGPPSRGTG